MRIVNGDIFPIYKLFLKYSLVANTTLRGSKETNIKLEIDNFIVTTEIN